MAKQIIRLTESDLHRIVKEAVNRILSEDGETGALAGDSGAGMSLDFGGDSQPAEDKGATSSLRNKTYTAPFTKKKDKSLTRPKGNTTGIQDKADWNVNM